MSEQLELSEEIDPNATPLSEPGGWSHPDKRAFWMAVKGCFNKATKTDAKDAYERCKPYGSKAGCEALRKLRDAEKGEAWRPNLVRLEAIAKQLAGAEIMAVERAMELAAAQGRYKLLQNHPIKQDYDLAQRAAAATSDTDLAEMRDELFKARPDLKDIYGPTVNPRKRCSLLVVMFAPNSAAATQKMAS